MTGSANLTFKFILKSLAIIWKNPQPIFFKKENKRTEKLSFNVPSPSDNKFLENELTRIYLDLYIHFLKLP